ncbi:hypothetical protein [Streptomyces sp. NPDC059651]|uniref:hypothetical protein n=1 Tax=Streptomyces sp. NPDC059651 TaxID=3346897 RepID=UPI0036B3BBF2
MVKDRDRSDSPGNIFTAMMNRTEFGFFDAEDAYIGNTNPKVREFFRATAQAIADKQPGALQPFCQQGNEGIKQGRMTTTMTCPA